MLDIGTEQNSCLHYFKTWSRNPHAGLSDRADVLASNTSSAPRRHPSHRLDSLTEQSSFAFDGPETHMLD